MKMKKKKYKKSSLSWGVVGITLIFVSCLTNPASGKEGLVRSITVESNTQHDFESVAGSRLLGDVSQSVIIGHPHPDREIRIIFGSYSTSNSDLTVLKHWGDRFNFVLEGTYTYAVQGLTPLLCYDFDGDREEEILVSTGVPSQMLFLRWNGTGYYPIWQNISSQIPYQHQAQAQDIDNDGLPELITCNWAGTNIYSWDANFTNFRLVYTIPHGGGLYAHVTQIGIGDIDNDNDQEIILSAYSDLDNKSIRFWGFDGSNYTEEFSAYYPDYSYGFSTTTVVDIDSDGQMEAIAGTLPEYGNFDTESFPIVLLKWNGSYLEPTTIFMDINPHLQLRAADIDEDGDPEVLVDQNGGWASLVEVDKTGEVIGMQTNFFCVGTIEFYDFDLDGVLEILSPAHVSGSDYNLVLRDRYAFIIHDTRIPYVEKIVYHPADPKLGDSVIMEATITDESGVAEANITYRLNGGLWITEPLLHSYLDVYVHHFGVFTKPTLIEYYITAVDISPNQNTRIDDNNGQYYRITLEGDETSTTTDITTTTGQKITPSVEISFLITSLIILIIGRRKKPRDRH